MAYGSDTDFIAYLAASGRSLPVGVDVTVARQWGSVYVNSWDDRFKGIAIALPDSFPRDLWPVVPVSVEYATYEAGFAWATGAWDVTGGGGTSGGQVTREKIDVLEVAYASPEAGTSWWDNNRFIIPLAYALLLPFMKPQNGKCAGGAAAFVV